MQYETKARLLTAESKPYNVGGNTGTSHRIRLNIEGEIYVCKSSEEQVRNLKAYEGKDGQARINVNSRKENLSLELIKFVPDSE